MKSINMSNTFSGFKDLILAAVSLPDIFNCYLRALKLQFNGTFDLEKLGCFPNRQKPVELSREHGKTLFD